MLTVKSKLKDLLANDEAVEIIQKYVPEFSRDDPRLTAGLNYSLKAISKFPQAGMSQEQLQQIADALEEADLD